MDDRPYGKQAVVAISELREIGLKYARDIAAPGTSPEKVIDAARLYEEYLRGDIHGGT